MRGGFRAIWGLAAALVFLLVTEGLRAQWKAEGSGPFRYDDPQNWVDGVISDKITNDPGFEQTIEFTTDRKMPDGLLLRREAPPGGRVLALHFKGRNAADTVAESRTLTLGGPVTVDFGRTNDQTAFFGENDPINFGFEGKPAVFDLTTGNSHIQVRGVISGRGLIVRGGGPQRGGGGRLSLIGKQGIGGRVSLEGANLYLFGTASLADIESISLSGRSTLSLQGDEGGLMDVLPDGAPIVCSGETEIRLLGGKNALSESIGKVFFVQNGLELWASGQENAGAQLLLADLVRVSDGILIVGYEKPDAASRVKVQNDAPILNALVGGRGGEGSTTASILPWARGHGGGNLIATAGFLTYSRDLGFRELNKRDEYVGDPNASNPTNNVRISTETLNLLQPRRINSLYLDFADDGGQNTLDLSSNTLTVASGALSMAKVGQITNGMLTTGSALPLVITGPVYMNARLAGTGGLVYFGGRYPDLRLGSAENTLTGDYVITYGALRLGDTENIPDSVTVRLHGNAELVVDGSESITGLAGNGRVRMATRGRSILMLGRCEGFADHLIVGAGGELRPGDISKGRPGTGELTLWPEGDPNGKGGLEFEDGTLYIDLAGSSHDALIFGSEDKHANVEGGILRVNLLEGYRPKVGAKWEIIKGTAPAEGSGFEAIMDATGKGYRYAASPVGNNWVVEVIGVPDESPELGVMPSSSKNGSR